MVVCARVRLARRIVSLTLYSAGLAELVLGGEAALDLAHSGFVGGAVRLVHALAAVVPLPLQLGAVVLLDVVAAAELGDEQHVDGREGHARGGPDVELRLLELGRVGGGCGRGGRAAARMTNGTVNLMTAPDRKVPAAVRHCTLDIREGHGRDHRAEAGAERGHEGEAPGRAAGRPRRPRCPRSSRRWCRRRCAAASSWPDERARRKKRRWRRRSVAPSPPWTRARRSPSRPSSPGRRH